MADDHSVAEEVVAEGVVEVRVGVDKRADGLLGEARDLVAEEPGAALRGAGVDRDHLIAGDDEGRIVETPRAVVLDVGEDAVGDLDGLGVGQNVGVGDVLGAHCGSSSCAVWA